VWIIGAEVGQENTFDQQFVMLGISKIVQVPESGSGLSGNDLFELGGSPVQEFRHWIILECEVSVVPSSASEFVEMIVFPAHHDL